MIGELFESMTRAMEGGAALALGAAFVWGVMSIVLSPCHLASIPLVVGFIGGQGRVSTARAFVTASVFALGILITIAAIGAATAALGRIAGDLGSWGNFLVAGIFFLVGLNLLGVIPAPWTAPGAAPSQRRGVWAAFVLGLIFGIALGPCTFAFMAPVLGVAFRMASDNWVLGAALLLVYGLGHCGVIAVAGTFAGAVQRYLDWNERSRGATILKGACGVLVMLAGLWMIYVAP